MDQYFKDEPMDRAEQGPVRLRVLQRRAGTGPPAAEGSREARARPERLVRQRGADRVRAHRPRDRHLRQQHLQVLRRLQADRGGASAARRRQGRRQRPRAVAARAGFCRRHWQEEGIDIMSRFRMNVGVAAAALGLFTGARPAAAQATPRADHRPGRLPGRRVRRRRRHVVRLPSQLRHLRRVRDPLASHRLQAQRRFRGPAIST